MIHGQDTNNSKVLVELSVIPLGGNGQRKDQIADVMSVVEKTGLNYERTHTGSCIEGEWNDISPLIHACFQRVQERSPQGFLKVSIR